MPPLTLAWSNLTQQRLRTLISVVGVAFAVLLIFMQLGFQDAVRRTATLLYDKLDFDLVLTSTEYSNLARPAAFSRRRLAQARAVPGVERVLPLTAVLSLWTQPRRPTDPENEPPHKWSIMVLAVDPARLDTLFRRPYPDVFLDEAELRRDAVQLARLDTVLMDRASSPPYGDVPTWKLARYNDLNDRRVEIIGNIKVGTGFAYSGLLMTSESTLTHLMRWPDDRVSFGLVKLAPGTDVEAARAEIEARLGPPQESGVEVRTKPEINAKEIDFWMSGTAVGQFFTAGVVIALLVGGVFVYQMMASDISRRLPEYATVRALGYPRDYLSHVVYWQGFLLAVLGYVPGLAASLLGYLVTHKFANVPIEMTAWRATYVLALTVFMCMGSALVAVRSVHSANPADLF
ncbi:MAG: FtsX-like permease family protein [Gemmataceae bacterium]